jgi:hypothetical protein
VGRDWVEAISIHDGEDTPPSTQLSTASPKTASEQSNPNSEKTAKKLSEVMKRLSGSQSDAEFMAKASEWTIKFRGCCWTMLGQEIKGFRPGQEFSTFFFR